MFIAVITINIYILIIMLLLIILHIFTTSYYGYISPMIVLQSINHIINRVLTIII